MRCYLTPLLLLFSYLLCPDLLYAQDGQRAVAGGSYTFNAEAYKRDREVRQGKASGGSNTSSFSGGFPSLKQLKATRKAEKAEAQATYDNYLRIRQLDTLKIQTEKTIEFYDALIESKLQAFQYEEALNSTKSMFSVVNGLLQKRMALEAVSTYGDNKQALKTGITENEISQIADFHIYHLEALVETYNLTEAAWYYQQHFQRGNVDTGIGKWDQALAQVLHAQSYALKGDRTKAETELADATAYHKGRIPHFSDLDFHIGFIYLYTGQEEKGADLIIVAINNESSDEASLLYASALDKMERYFKAKGANIAASTAYNRIAALKYKDTYKKELRSAIEDLGEPIREIMNNPNSRWWLRYVK